MNVSWGIAPSLNVPEKIAWTNGMTSILLYLFIIVTLIRDASTWGLQSAIVCMCKIIFCYVLSPNLFSLDAPVAGYSHRRLWILFLIPCRRKWSWLAVFFTHPPVHYVHLSLAPLQKCGLYEWMTATNIFTARHTFELRVVVSLY